MFILEIRYIARKVIPEKISPVYEDQFLCVKCTAFKDALLFRKSKEPINVILHIVLFVIFLSIIICIELYPTYEFIHSLRESNSKRPMRPYTTSPPHIIGECIQIVTTRIFLSHP